MLQITAPLQAFDHRTNNISKKNQQVHPARMLTPVSRSRLAYYTLPVKTIALQVFE